MSNNVGDVEVNGIPIRMFENMVKNLETELQVMKEEESERQARIKESDVELGTLIDAEWEREFSHDEVREHMTKKRILKEEYNRLSGESNEYQWTVTDMESSIRKMYDRIREMVIEAENHLAGGAPVLGEGAL